MNSWEKGPRAGLWKVPGITDLDLKPRKINSVAILGGGRMGSGIATALILGNYRVILKEVNEKFLETWIGRVKGQFTKSGQKRNDDSRELSEDPYSSDVLDYECVKYVDLVIEVVIENVAFKQQKKFDLEKYYPPHCILSSNTSTIDFNLIGEKTKSQDRIVGAHFFNPAHVFLLLEIVCTEKTYPLVVVDLLDIGKLIHKTPIVVGNCTGFAVNRMFFPHTQFRSGGLAEHEQIGHTGLIANEILHYAIKEDWVFPPPAMEGIRNPMGNKNMEGARP